MTRNEIISHDCTNTGITLVRKNNTLKNTVSCLEGEFNSPETASSEGGRLS
jgi:hypothetical protein